MEWVRLDAYASESLGRHVFAYRVVARVELRADAEAGLGLRRTDEGNDRFPADKRTPPPVLCDVGEESVLDLVPLAGAWGEVTDAYVEPCCIREALQLDAPQSRTGRIAPTPV